MGNYIIQIETIPSIAMFDMPYICAGIATSDQDIG